jgi:CTP synthase
VPWIPAAGELKTKPTQHSVQKLREIGSCPDALLCRADRPIPDEERAKISLFANVHEFGVISVWDVDSIYKVPRMLHAQGLDELICAKLQLHTKPGQPGALGQAGRRGRASQARGHDRDVRQVRRALRLVQVAQRGAAPRRHPQPRAGQGRVDRFEDITATNVSNLARFDAILVPGGFGKRGVEGKILAAQFAREKKIPYLGICLGMQVATIEYARTRPASPAPTAPSSIRSPSIR